MVDAASGTASGGGPSGADGLPFVGRAAELRTVVEVLSSAPATVLVQGEAGSGKSRLVQEAGAVLSGRGVRVIVGSCHPLREAFPFGPVVDALQGAGPWLPAPEVLNPVAGALAALLPELAPQLPPPPAPLAMPPPNAIG